MKRAAIIEENIVKNIITVGDDYDGAAVLINPSEAIHIGWHYKEGIFFDPNPEPDRVPDYIELRKPVLKELDGEGMDAIRREIAALRAGQPETAEYKSYREKVEAIKTKHPKGGAV